MPIGGGVVLEGQGEKRTYPLISSEYKLFEEVGQGVSATVYRAHCLTYNETVAIKSLDLEKCNSNLVSYFPPLFFDMSYTVSSNHVIILSHYLLASDWWAEANLI